MFGFHIWKCQLGRPSRPVPESTGGAQGCLPSSSVVCFTCCGAGAGVGQGASAGSSLLPTTSCAATCAPASRAAAPVQPSPCSVRAEPGDRLSPGGWFVVIGENDPLRCKETEDIVPAPTCCFLQSASQTRIPWELVAGTSACRALHSHSGQ